MNNWGRVYYTNLLSCIAVSVILLLFRVDHDFNEWRDTKALPNAWMALVASCLCGLGLSYSASFCRCSVSATMCTVVGIICKIATIVVNCLI
mmetsp:Transcript_13985/g.39577  ORF Transcript_13985/g.39577 Transcript_13985/m.39577 type:complete len:92 (+) Transcript_13985:1114-1389(+)